MSKRSVSLLISDMLDCVDHATNYTSGQSFNEFLMDRKTRDAVLRVLSVLGEAANRAPKEIRDAYPEVEWTKIMRSRNLIIHDYEIVDYSVVWKIVTVHLPILKVSLTRILASLGPE
jgi:uncharacterized protein with HEPN domain